MRVLNHAVFIVIGVIVGLGIGQILKQPTKSQGAVPAARQPMLGLNRHQLATSLYASLPKLVAPSVDEIGGHWRDLASAKSPARQRADYRRLRLELMVDPSIAPDVVEQVVDAATGANNLRAVLSKMYRVWAANDPVAAMDSLASIETHDLRYQAMSGALKAWAESDPTAALAYISESTLGMVAERGANMFLRYLAESDPQRALKEVRLLGDTDLERSIHGALIANQAETNMESAWKEIDVLTDRDLQQSLRGTAIQALARKDKPQALTYIDRLEDKTQRQYALMNLFGEWPISDPEEAKVAFAKYPKEALPSNVPFMFGQSMNLAGSREALAFSRLLEGEVRENYLLGVLTEQAIKQPAKTAAIVTDYFQEDDQLRQVYRHLGGAWAGQDEHAAAEWVANLQPSAARDEAVSSFSKRLFSIDPERALQWASSIADGKERVRRTDKLIEQWRAQNAESADAWLKRSATDQ